jgi:hypothetical protein
LRSAQIDIQAALRDLGLVLNAAKTKLLEGADLVATARKIQSSAIDDALMNDQPDTEPLEQLIDSILDEQELADHTSIRFATSRMRWYRVNYRLDEILEMAVRMPHAANHLSRLFRKTISSSVMQDWLLDYAESPWNRFEWSMAQFGTAIPSARPPRRETLELFERILFSDANSVPLVALAAQRLAAWHRDDALLSIRERIADEPSPHLRRVLALAGRHAGASKAEMRRWLGQFPENHVTLAMLEHRNFFPPSVARDYL